MSLKAFITENNKLIQLDEKHKTEKKDLEISIGNAQIKRFKEDTKEMMDLFKELGVQTSIRHYQNGSSELSIMWSNAMWIEIKQEKNESTFTWGIRSSYDTNVREPFTDKNITDVLTKGMAEVVRRFGRDSLDARFRKLYEL